jgi:hypothetical protein
MRPAGAARPGTTPAARLLRKRGRLAGVLLEREDGDPRRPAVDATVDAAIDSPVISPDRPCVASSVGCSPPASPPPSHATPASFTAEEGAHATGNTSGSVSGHRAMTHWTPRGPRAERYRRQQAAPGAVF